jgi:prepilin-type N-terminal cleavage/methylation domain-containing protein
MEKYCKNRKRGFTLVELLISMVAGLAVMAAIYGAMLATQRVSRNTDSRLVTQQDARAVLDLMAMEIRMASYNPLRVPSTMIGNALGCGIALNAAFKGIQIANLTTIAVAMDLDGSQTIGNVENEYIQYNYNGVDTITRLTNCGNPQSILGGVVSGSNVRNAAAGVPLFQYFDINGQPTAVIPNIRRIKITIVADTNLIDPVTHKPRRMIYSTNVMVRNHVLSP